MGVEALAAFQLEEASLAAFQLAGAGTEAYGTYAEGKMVNYAEKRNAAMSEAEAANVAASADAEIRKVRKEAKTLISRQGALYAKAGVRFQGSALKVACESMANAEMDVIMMEYNKRVEVDKLKSDAEYRRMLGKNAQRAANAKAATQFAKSSGKTLISTSADKSALDKDVSE